MESQRFARIFDTILRQVSFNEAAIIESEKLNTGNWAIHKTRLYEHILNSLQQFHKRQGPERKIINLLDQAEILYQKGLYSQAETLLQKAEKTAREYDKNLLLARVIEWKRRVAYFTLSKDEKPTGKASKKIVSQIGTTSFLHQLNTDIYAIFSDQGRVARSESARSEMKQLLHKAHNEVAENSLNEPQLMKLNRALQIAYSVLGEAEQSYTHSNRNRILFESSSHPEALNKDDYLSAYNQMVIACHILEDTSRARQVIAELRSLPDSNPAFDSIHYQSRIFDYSAFHELEGYILDQNKEKLEGSLPQLERDLEAKSSLLNPVNLQSKRYRIALGYFILGKYRQGLKRLALLRSNQHKTFRKDIKDSIDLLYLMAHFALDNWEVLEREVPVVKNYLKLHKRLYQPQQKLLQILEDSFSSNNADWQITKHQIAALRHSESEAPKGVRTICYFSISDWLQTFSNQQVLVHSS